MLVDADMLLAGASLVVLRMAEITLIEALTSQQVIAEAERNLADYLPGALSAFRMIVSRCLRVVDDPAPADLAVHQGQADPNDLPIFAAAVRQACPWLVTFNTRHFQPGHPAVTILRPGEFVQHVRGLLASLSPDQAG